MIKFRKDVRLAPFSTLGMGGRAEYFYETKTPEDLIYASESAKKLKIPFKIFAGGSNIVFPDGRLKGLLVRFRGGRISVKGNKLVADAGVDLADVIKRSINLGLKGLEMLSGIPGTLGGAVVGNAGAYGHSISEVVNQVEFFDPFDVCECRWGKREWLENSGCKFGYRESILKHRPYLVLRVKLGFKKGNAKRLREISRDIIRVRRKKYKPGLKCPGSFFKNVLVNDVSKRSLGLIKKDKIIDGKIPAGYLLEEIGARGMRLGGIQVADFHGNLLMNTGRAKAKDVKKLAQILKQKVRRRFGIKLEEEVRYF